MEIKPRTSSLISALPSPLRKFGKGDDGWMHPSVNEVHEVHPFQHTRHSVSSIQDCVPRISIRYSTHCTVNNTEKFQVEPLYYVLLFIICCLLYSIVFYFTQSDERWNDEGCLPEVRLVADLRLEHISRLMLSSTPTYLLTLPTRYISANYSDTWFTYKIHASSLIDISYTRTVVQSPIKRLQVSQVSHQQTDQAFHLISPHPTTRIPFWHLLMISIQVIPPTQ